jgi:DNA-binding LacI/PurR family transcriptional regulator
VRELLPRVSRVVVLWNAANPYSALVFKETQTAAASTAVDLYSLEVRSPSDLDTAFQSAIRQRPDAMITASEQRGRDGEAKRLSRLEIDHQLELGRLFNWKIGGFGSPKDFAHVPGSPPLTR